MYYSFGLPRAVNRMTKAENVRANRDQSDRHSPFVTVITDVPCGVLSASGRSLNTWRGLPSDAIEEAMDRIHSET